MRETDVEVAALICKDGEEELILRVYIGIPGYVPDSRQRWLDIWNNMENIYEIAHTHPRGARCFSAEDRTTMRAVEIGTGKKFRWSVITEYGYLVRNESGKKYGCEGHESWWVDVLRALSYGVKRDD